MIRLQKVNEKFERDLIHLVPKLKKDKEFATDVYRALCNMRWRSKWTPFKYSCSWRYAGGLIAKLRDQGEDYIDFYCSGDEGKVTDEVRKIFNQLGWIPSPWAKDKDETIFNKVKTITKEYIEFIKT